MLHLRPCVVFAPAVQGNPLALATVISTSVSDPNYQNLVGSAFGTFSYAAAVPASVPVPAAAWLFGSGLLGLIGVARRKARAA